MMIFVQKMDKKLIRKKIMIWIITILLLFIPAFAYACSPGLPQKIMPFELLMPILMNLILPSAVLIFLYNIFTPNSGDESNKNTSNDNDIDIKKAIHRFLEHIVYNGLLLMGYLMILSVFVNFAESSLYNLWARSFIQTFINIWGEIIQSKKIGILLIIWACIWALISVLKQIIKKKIENTKQALKSIGLKCSYNIFVFPGLFWLGMWFMKMNYLTEIIQISLVIAIILTSVLFSMNQGSYRKTLIKDILFKISYISLIVLIAFFSYGVLLLLSWIVNALMHRKQIFISVIMLMIIVLLLYFFIKEAIKEGKRGKQKLRKMMKYFLYNFVLLFGWLLIFNQLDQGQQYKLFEQNKIKYPDVIEDCTTLSADYYTILYPEYVRPKPRVPDQVKTIIFSHFGFLLIYTVLWGIIAPNIEYIWRKKMQKEDLYCSKTSRKQYMLLILWNISIFIVIYIIFGLL